MNGKSYYPNNWDVIKDAPDEVFEPCSWEEFFEWRMCAWEIPSSVNCILRAQRIDTGEVTEHVYQQPKAAQKRLIKYMQDGEHEVTICNSDSIHLVKVTNYDDTDDD